MSVEVILSHQLRGAFRTSPSPVPPPTYRVFRGGECCTNNRTSRVSQLVLPPAAWRLWCFITACTASPKHRLQGERFMMSVDVILPVATWRFLYFAAACTASNIPGVQGRENAIRTTVHHESHN
jgi:hypothetical protein